MRIGVFDSGLGGINVLKELVNVYPNNDYYYLGDNKNMPYGDKSYDELLKLAKDNIHFLLTKNVDIVIIACGTISSTCYLDLKKEFNIPIYDIISPTIKCLRNSSYQNIGVIGTTRTIESRVFDIANKNVLMKNTPEFVPFIESFTFNKNKNKILDTLECFKNYDALVLGCTHYPILSDIIKEKYNFALIDMGKCLVNELNLDDNKKGTIHLYFSKLDNDLENRVKQIFPFEFIFKKKD